MEKTVKTKAPSRKILSGARQIKDLPWPRNLLAMVSRQVVDDGKGQARPIPQDVSPEHAAHIAELLPSVLMPRAIKAVLMFYRDGMNSTAIGEQLGVSNVTVCTDIRNALKELSQPGILDKLFDKLEATEQPVASQDDDLADLGREEQELADRLAIQNERLAKLQQQWEMACQQEAALIELIRLKGINNLALTEILRQYAMQPTGELPFNIQGT